MHIHTFIHWLNEAAAPVPTSQLEDGLEIVQGLVDRGFGPKAAAAIAGNMWQESKFNPAVRPASASYVGLAQWGGPRKGQLIKKPNWNTTSTQLDHVKIEFDTIPAFKSILPELERLDIRAAAEKVARKYEGCADPTNPNRLNSAAQLYSEWQKQNEVPAAYLGPDDTADDSAFGEPSTKTN